MTNVIIHEVASIPATASIAKIDNVKVVIDSLKSGSGSIPKGKSNKRRESKSNQLVKIVKSKV